MDLTIQDLYTMAARGENLTSGELLEVASSMKRGHEENARLKQINVQLRTQIDLLRQMNLVAMNAAGSAKTIDEISSEIMVDNPSSTKLYNAFEVRQILHAFEIAEDKYTTIKTDYDRIFTTPFLARQPKSNLREVFQLLKAQPNALFYGSELAMLRKWGTDRDRNLSIVKCRLGRAFTDPVGYMDPRFDLILSKTTKRSMLDGNAMRADAYQHAVFSRPDFLKIHADWVLSDGRTQFHAGPFHTHTDSGRWWCGTHFTNLTAAELMKTLETALGELRLLYIHFPEGIQNEELCESPSAS